MIKKILFLVLFFHISLVSFSQNVIISDAIFKSKLLSANSNNTVAKNLQGNWFKIDSNSDGEIQVTEALEVSYLDVTCSGNCSISQRIRSLEGLNSFQNIVSLVTSGNRLGSIDLSGMLKLEIFQSISSVISSLNLQGLPVIKDVRINDNILTSLNVQGLNSLKRLDCPGNRLTSLNLSGLSNLEGIQVNGNYLTEINLQGLSSLKNFICTGNQLQLLDLTDLVNLESLFCQSNDLLTLDLSKQEKLYDINFINNFNLQTLFMKNGKKQRVLNFSGFYNLRYVCCDEDEIEMMRNGIWADLNCEVNSYCSFTPGGSFYNISGVSRFSNYSTCNEIAFATPFIKLSNRNEEGELKGIYFANKDGEYSIDVYEGEHEIIPELPNNSLFNLNPIVADFPTTQSPLTQNICITPNGIHQDLEVVLVPRFAIPGFDSDYTLVYKNNGNTTVSGDISLWFVDSLMDFVHATPNLDLQQGNLLKWQYVDLKPFESRTIHFTMNLNSPVEVPPLNINELLYFGAVITPLENDVFLRDNYAVLRQKTVGSYDPNDKICLEGDVVEQEIIGEYVHYVIRFENTGTYFAKNVVIKDIIDLSKFDINTFMPLYGSHNFTTKISSDNVVEFFFEEIQLPFPPSELRYGFVAFKIKTKPTLVLGETFSNQASIYFDYNTPIITDNFISTIVAALSINESDYKTKLVLSPNPVEDYLDFKTTSSISKVEVYDMNGRILSALPINNKRLNLSHLIKGNYILKIYVNDEIIARKVIKQ